MSKKKFLTAGVALATAAVLALGGTFAWQGLNQTALNEGSDIVNPGGRLHDDFDGTNKDVYVENFTDPDQGGEDIYARIRLEEYFEVIMNKGVEGAETSNVLLGSKDTVDGETTYTYELYKFDDANKNDDGSFKAAVTDGNSYWNWAVGGSDEVYYMPTFNKNKDSLAADTNGNYVDAVGGISNRDGTQYENYVQYAAGDSKTATEIYDGDTNSLDEVGTDFENLEAYAENIVTVEDVTHEAKPLEETTALVSMADWLAGDRAAGNYWVYDTDGWVYWANPIKAGETTGRLLDGIALSGVMDDTWYYAINVVAQFITGDDAGKADNTGFYDTAAGAAPSEDAEILLTTIGVELADANESEEEHQYTISFQYNFLSSSDRENAPCSNIATLLVNGETYSGDVDIAWNLRPAAGYSIDSSETQIYKGEGQVHPGSASVTIQLGKEMDASVPNAHKIFIVTAYLDHTAVASANVLVLPFRSENNLMYGFTFWNNGVETEANALQTDVTYDLKAYTYLYLEGQDQDMSDVFKPTVKPADMTELKVYSNIALNIEATADEAALADGKLTLYKPGEYTLSANVNDCETAEYVVQCKVNAIGELDESDITAPTFVSAENPSGSNNFMTWNMKINGLSEGDFPLTLKGYYLDSQDAPISGEPYFTSEITVDEGVVSAEITCADQYTMYFNDGNDSTYDADAGTLDLFYHWRTDTTGKYAALTITDASGNTGSLSNSIWVVAGKGCFTAGTQVSGPDGMVNIENIEEGDQVWSLDLASGRKAAVTVLKVHDQWVNDEFYHITAGSETITATPEHLFYVNGEWVEARDLCVGDKLVSLNGAENTAITAIEYEKLDAPITVYNLTVDGDHNFLITNSDLVVHNVSK